MPLVMQILTDDVLVRGDSSLLRSLASIAKLRY
jgi:ABC-type bacteriocin/lantibiotic exporter with double-glycine peptidase domain